MHLQERVRADCDFGLEGDSVILDEPVFGINQVIPGHELTEALEAIFGAEQVGERLGKVILLVADNSQFDASLATKREVLLVADVAVAMKKESQVFGVAILLGFDCDPPGIAIHVSCVRGNRLGQFGDAGDGESEGVVRSGGAGLLHLIKNLNFFLVVASLILTFSVSVVLFNKCLQIVTFSIACFDIWNTMLTFFYRVHRGLEILLFSFPFFLQFVTALFQMVVLKMKRTLLKMMKKSDLFFNYHFVNKLTLFANVA